MRLSRKRREAIILAFVRVTKGYPVRSLSGLLAALREHVADVTEAEVRKSIAWSLRQSRRSGALFERKLRAARTMSGADCGVSG
jgi:3-methyladenine DNA glycosylase AlkD